MAELIKCPLRSKKIKRRAKCLLHSPVHTIPPVAPLFHLLVIVSKCLLEESLKNRVSFPFLSKPFINTVIEFSRQSSECIVAFFLKIRTTHPFFSLFSWPDPRFTRICQRLWVSFCLLIFFARWGEFSLSRTVIWSRNPSLFTHLSLLLRFVLPFQSEDFPSLSYTIWEPSSVPNSRSVFLVLASNITWKQHAACTPPSFSFFLLFFGL